MDMNQIKIINKKDIGFNGENKILDKLKTNGFSLYKRNVKYGYVEIDLIVYKFNEYKKTLDIRIVEVKTRSAVTYDLNYFGLDKKWINIIKYIFTIKRDIDGLFADLRYSEIHFDFALVRYTESGFEISKYIKDINLLL